jgi:hypothetical protein
MNLSNVHSHMLKLYIDDKIQLKYVRPRKKGTEESIRKAYDEFIQSGE